MNYKSPKYISYVKIGVRVIILKEFLMNENPGETPNPLNPTPAAGPAPNPMPSAAPSPAPNPDPSPVAPTPIANSTPGATPTQTPAQPIAPVTNTIKVDSLAPEDRPMEKAAPAEAAPVKKKKTGLIAGIVAAVVVLILGGVAAAIVIIMMNQTDPVTAAMKKIMDGKAPTNVAIDGDINITLNNEFSPVSNIKIALNSKIISSSAINNSVANVTATIRNVGDFNIEFDEVYAGNGDLYFKIDGATSALEDSGILYLLNLSNQMPGQIDCGEDAVCQTTEIQALTCADGENCNLTEIDDTKLNVLDGGQNVLDANTIAYFASLAGVIKVVDGEWLKVSVDELNMLSGGITANSNISCITNLVSDINTNSNSAIELYSKYPFISSTNKDVSLASKNHPVYQVSVNSEKFANFVNSIQNSEMTANLYSCLGWTNNVSVSEDDVAKMVDVMPKIYAEVDGDNNFTRLYLTSNLNNGEGTMTIDLGFSYPTNVNVPEPEEYKNFSDVIQEIMSSMYSLPAGA